VNRCANSRPQKGDLLRRFDGLPFRIIADQDEVAMGRGHGLLRVRRADDRESLRCERKTEQDADGEPFHITVSLCIIRAMEIPNSAREAQWLNHHRRGM